MTEAELYALDKITAQDASKYLGLSPQVCRVLARSGKIGEPVGNTNRVLFQPRKLVAYKTGEPLEDDHIEELAQRIAAAIVKIAREGTA